MTVSFKNGKLVIEIDANVESPPVSHTGKSRIVASDTTKVNVAGKPLTVSVNAYAVIPKAERLTT